MPLSILLVEDDPDDHVLTRDLLIEAGTQFELDWVTTVDEAIGALATERHDVALVDFRLGGRDGTEVLAEAVHRGWRTPIVMLTGQAADETDRRALELGAADYLEKHRLEATTLDRSIRYAVDRARITSQIKERELRFRSLAELLPGAVYICRPDRVRSLVYASQHLETLTGTAVDDFLKGKASLLEHYHPDDLHRVLTAVQAAVSEGRPYRFTVRLRHRDGTVTTVEEHGQAVADASGHLLEGTLLPRGEPAPAGQSGRSRPERDTFDDPFEAQKLASVGAAATGIAHDFNNWLSAIGGYGQLALQQLGDGHPAYRLVERCVRASDCAGYLVQQLLGYAGHAGLERRPLDLSAQITEISALLTTRISPKARLRLDLASGLPAIEGNVGQIQQVVMNLVLNASDALGAEGGTITVATAPVSAAEISSRPGRQLQDRTYVALVVEDTGRGMDAAERARIFDRRFSRSGRPGRGLGLTVVKQIVTEHEALLEVTSCPGQGTRFDIYWVASSQPAERSLRHPEEALRGRGGVLVADGHPDARAVATMTLERYGYEVTAVADGDRALEIASAMPERFVALVLELALPGRGGDEVAAALRGAGIDVPILFTSGYTSADRLADLTVPRSSYVQKPFAPVELASRLGALVAESGEAVTTGRERRPTLGGAGRLAVGLALTTLVALGMAAGAGKDPFGDGAALDAEALLGITSLFLLLVSVEAWRARRLVTRRASELEATSAALAAEVAEREAAERFLDSIVTHLPDMVFVKEADGLTFVRINRAGEALIGHCSEELLGRSDHDFFPPEQAASFVAADREVLASGRLRDIPEEPIRTPHGVRYLHTKKVPILDESGSPRYLLGISQDVTERKRFEAELAESTRNLVRLNRALVARNEELGQFANAASHDLREPLRKIMAFGSRVQALGVTAGDERLQDYLDRMLGAARRMEGLLDGLLALGEAGTRALSLAPTDLTDVVRDVLDDLTVELERTRGHVALEGTPWPAAQADRRDMHRLFLNLVGNALKYHRAGVPPEVVVRCRRSDDGAHVHAEVVDRGIGFPENDAERIFLPFQRLHGRDAYEGSGIGLSLCRRIVERHRGQLAADGRPGLGSTFRVTLPAAHPARSDVPTDPCPAGPADATTAAPAPAPDPRDAPT